MNLNNIKDVEALVALLKNFDPTRLTTEVVTLGEEWADRDSAAASLEETKKTLLAKLTLEHMDSAVSGRPGEKPRALPVSQAELRALADPLYEQHLDMMVAARRESNISRVRYDLGKMKLELMRSLQATMRQEMRLTGN